MGTEKKSKYGQRLGFASCQCRTVLPRGRQVLFWGMLPPHGNEAPPHFPPKPSACGQAARGWGKFATKASVGFKVNKGS